MIYLYVMRGGERRYSTTSASTTSDTPEESLPIESMAEILLIARKAGAGL